MASMTRSRSASARACLAVWAALRSLSRCRYAASSEPSSLDRSAMAALEGRGAWTLGQSNAREVRGPLTAMPLAKGPGASGRTMPGCPARQGTHGHALEAVDGARHDATVMLAMRALRQLRRGVEQPSL